MMRALRFIFTLTLIVVSTAVQVQAEALLRDDALFRVRSVRADRTIEMGTAFAINRRDLIVTAYHVVAGAREILLTKPGGRLENATVEYLWPERDIAVLRIGRKIENPYPIASSSVARSIGKDITVHGYPLGFSAKTLKGNVTQDGLQPGKEWTYRRSKKGKSESIESIFTDPKIEVLAIDVTVENGMSGAPVVAADGTVIGILSGSRRPGRGLAWAIPIDILNFDRLREEHRLPSQVSWPRVAFLKPGVDWGRGRAIVPVDSVSELCRRAVTTFHISLDDLEHQATDVLTQIDAVDDVLASTRALLTEGRDPQAARAKAEYAVKSLAPVFKLMDSALEARRSAESEMNYRCGGGAGLRLMGGAELPATYDNLIRIDRLTARQREILGSASAYEGERKLVKSEVKRLLNLESDIFLALPRLKTHAETAQFLLKFVAIRAQAARLYTRDGKATRVLRKTAEALESQADVIASGEATPFENTRKNYIVSGSGYKATLSSGWLPLDEKLLAVVATPSEYSYLKGATAVYVERLRKRAPVAVAAIVPAAKWDSEIAKAIVPEMRIWMGQRKAREDARAWMSKLAQATKGNVSVLADRVTKIGAESLVTLVGEINNSRGGKLALTSVARVGANDSVYVRCWSAAVPKRLPDLCQLLGQGISFE